MECRMDFQVELVTPSPVKKHAADRIKRVLKRHLDKFGIENVKITPGHDHDGDPVIFIDLRLKVLDVDGDTLLETLSHLRDDLLNHGETRFPHLRHLSDTRSRLQ
jgi:hypothetical protein